MILCLDAGNSRLKFGLYAAGRWQARGALAYEECAQLPARLPGAPSALVACNVAGPAARARLEALAAACAAPLRWLVSSGAACGVENAYAEPQRLGSDRWAALIGARALHHGAAVVVMAGTATTIDQLDASGRFRGGLILPGLRLMRAALAANTADLPFAKGGYSSAPTNTDDAIVAGSLHATLGAIERMRAALGHEATVLLSGGAAAELAPHQAAPHLAVENLVLEGLAHYAQTPG